MALTDISGKTVERYFEKGGEIVSLRGDGYRSLRLLVSKVRSTRPFKFGFSEDFIEAEIFKWWKDSLSGISEEKLSDYLLKRCAESFIEHRMLIPLTGVEIERSFILGGVLIAPFNLDLIDDFENRMIEGGKIGAEEVKAKADDFRRKYGHTTVVEKTFWGEIKFCEERALELADDVADILRFMCPIAPRWDVNFKCFPIGRQSVPTQTAIVVKDGRLSKITNSISGTNPFRWLLKYDELVRIMEELHFENTALFFEGDELNSFQKRVKTAISAYSQAVAADDVRNRIMYAMSAAEHLLLKDASEPIQSSVGERLAFAIAKGSDYRMQIVENFKKAYKIRSKHVHHLSHVEDEETLEMFFINVFLMIRGCVELLYSFKNHSDFIAELDRIKFT